MILRPRRQGSCGLFDGAWVRLVRRLASTASILKKRCLPQSFQPTNGKGSTWLHSSRMPFKQSVLRCSEGSFTKNVTSELAVFRLASFEWPATQIGSVRSLQSAAKSFKPQQHRPLKASTLVRWKLAFAAFDTSRPEEVCNVSNVPFYWCCWICVLAFVLVNEYAWKKQCHAHKAILVRTR